jgi:hypothetical protein
LILIRSREELSELKTGPSSLSDSGFDFRVYADDGVTHRCDWWTRVGWP